MKIRFYGKGAVLPEKVESNIAHAKSLGLPSIGEFGVTRLAVIGGGHSIGDYVDELKHFDGDRWIVAGAFQWCFENGIEGAFMACGAEPCISGLAKGAKRAILASCVDPSLFEALKDADVRVFDLVHGENINHGPSTASCAPVQAIYAGFKEITFYGCDSSFPMEGTTHLYEHVDEPYRVLLTCNGETFHTSGGLLLQAEYLSAVIRLAPHVFKEKSAGLLRAMVADENYDITHRSTDLVKLMEAA